jgi:hypothetical protein
MRGCSFLEAVQFSQSLLVLLGWRISLEIIVNFSAYQEVSENNAIMTGPCMFEKKTASCMSSTSVRTHSLKVFRIIDRIPIGADHLVNHLKYLEYASLTGITAFQSCYVNRNSFKLVIPNVHEEAPIHCNFKQ